MLILTLSYIYVIIIMIKIGKSVLEYVFAILKMKCSSVKVKFMFLSIIHLLNSLMREWVSSQPQSI